MARKSILDGGASQTYSACYGRDCEAPARKAVMLTEINEHGSQVNVVPLCKNCETKAHKNAATRGLAAPKSVRFTKKIAEDFNEENAVMGVTRNARAINPHKANKERLQGKRPVNSKRPNLIGQGPEAETRFHTTRINQLDPERAMPVSAVGSKTPLGRAYRVRHMGIAKRRRTPKEQENLINEARKGGKMYE